MTLLVNRIGRAICWSLLALFVLGVGGCVVENYRGHYLWKKYRQEWEAKGERFDIAAFIPRPVPPDQNFATTPFFAPYLDYTIDESDREHPQRWKDKQGYERNKALAAGPGDLRAKMKKAPDTGRWQIGTFTDLQLWQQFFDGNTNFPFAAPPQDPAPMFSPRCVDTTHYSKNFALPAPGPTPSSRCIMRKISTPCCRILPR